MARFHFQWDGVEYPVPEKGFFELVEQIEDHISIPTLLQMTTTGNINFSRLARPVHLLLQHCGVPNAPDLPQLREALLAEGLQRMTDFAEGREPRSGQGMAVVELITKVLMGDAPLKLQEEEAERPKKAKPHSSNRATKSRSANGGSARPNSTR
jgi:hypothetical protein